MAQGGTGAGAPGIIRVRTGCDAHCHASVACGPHRSFVHCGRAGNALGTTPGAQNWTLAGLAAGDRFTLAVSLVPEPGSLALLLAGLAAVAPAVRRRA